MGLRNQHVEWLTSEQLNAYTNQVPWDQQLYIPPAGCGVTSGGNTFRLYLLTFFFEQSWVDS